MCSSDLPRSIPDVFVDDELVIVGRYRGDARALRFLVSGTLAERPLRVDVTASAAPAPWVGRRWAIARTDHLLEQIALEGERPELRAEVTSLALAYRFVTPYTAFLAIPERELTAEAARTLAAGRAAREAAGEQHADARAITSGGEALAQRSAMPADEEELDAEPAEAWSGGGADAVRAVETLGMAPPSADRAGCASCAVGAEP